VRTLLAALAVAAPFAVAPPAAVGPPLPAAPADTGDLIVRYAPGADAAQRADARRDAGVQRDESLPLARAEVVEPVAGVPVEEAVRRLEEDPAVQYAEPDVVRRASLTPDDRYFRAQWGLDNTGQAVGGASGTPDADVDAPEAWDRTTGADGVTVAIVDSGIDLDHPDLAPNLWQNPGEAGAAASNGADDDGNGFVDDARGWDFAATPDDATPQDGDGHGTHVSGTAAARGGDGIGVTGVAWRARIVPVRALGDDGSGTASDVLRAYDYARRAGARVVNASLGGSSPSRAERDAIAAAPDVLFVVAAGNDGADNDVLPAYPCNLDLPNVICVAASDRSDGLADFSNRGASTVDLGAPGVAIASTWLGGDWVLLDGTSMATPHVAGAAALLLARRPGATVADLRGALLGSVDQRPGLAGRTVTGGRLNVAAALDAITPPPAAEPAPPRESLPAPAPAPAPGPAPEQPSAPQPPPGPQAAPLGPAPAPAAPPPATTAGIDRAGPTLTVRPARRSLALVLRRGLPVTLGCSERCALRAELVAGARDARRLRLTTRSRSVGVARATRSLARAGRATVTLRLSARARSRLRRTRSVRLTLRVRATDAAGNPSTRTVRVTLRR